MSPGICHISKCHVLLRYMDSAEGELTYQPATHNREAPCWLELSLVPNLSGALLRPTKPQGLRVLRVRKRRHPSSEQTTSGKEAPETLIWDKIHPKIPTYGQMSSCQPWSPRSHFKQKPGSPFHGEGAFQCVPAPHTSAPQRRRRTGAPAPEHRVCLWEGDG